MRLQNLLNAFADTFTKITDFVKTLIVFLTEYIGSELMAYVTLGIVCFLAVAFLFFLILAIFNPKKRKLKKLRKALKIQNEYDTLRKRVFEISEEIGNINLEIRIIEKQSKDDVFNLNEIERTSLEQDEIFMTSKKYTIDDLVAKQAVLTEVLKKQKKGVFKSKDKSESTQLLINDLVSQQKICHNEITLKTAEIEQRKLQHAKDIENINNSCEQKRKELLDKKARLELEKIEIEAKIATFEEDGKHKLTFADAKAMTDEYTRQRRLADKEREDKALEELRIAKEKYELACKKRAKAEKDKDVAVENVKALQKQKAKAKAVKEVQYSPVTVAKAVRSNEKPDDVNIIIADIDSGIVYNPNAEEATTPLTEAEHVYKEPIIEVVDFDAIPEEDVVFVEAFLDYLNVDADDETILDESAITEETSIAFDNYESTNDPIEPVGAIQDDLTAEEESVQIIEEALPEDNEETPSQIEPNDESVEETVTIVEDFVEEATTVEATLAEDVEKEAQAEPIIIKKAPAYKDYNDGIPATPIYKTSKFQKPVTKLVKKAKPADNEVKADKAVELKSGYSGKWSIEEKDGKYLAKLVASNGGILLVTPSYSSENGVKSCIENVKQSLALDKISIHSDKEGKFFFKVLSSAGRTILQSSKYATKYQCEKSLASAKNFAQKAIIR